MKRLILISASLMMAATTFAQSDANSDNSLYSFGNAGQARVITKLGAAPEFPFLRNLSTPQQVLAAMKKQERGQTPASQKLDDLLIQLGYANGIKDLTVADITEDHVKPGTEGNMGSSGYTYNYARLQGDGEGFKAWKIAANTGGGAASANGPLYLMAKCGNAFYAKTTKRTACVNVPVSVTPDMKQLSLPNSGTVVTDKNETFVYYSRKHHRRHETANTVTGINDRYPSHLVRIDAEKDMKVIPQTYTVSLNSQQNNTVTACPDSTLNLTAAINLEKVSSYTGNYPDQDNKNYKKVSKHTYKMVAKRMRRIERKENKIARRTGVAVDVSTGKNA